MVYDAVCEAELDAAVSAACNDGTIELLMTHIQQDQLLAIPNDSLRSRVLTIPFVIAPTYGVVLGTSKNGLARWGEAEKIEAIRSPSGGHTEDALLAVTAQYDGATLVTNDKRLRNFAKRADIPVWSPPQFCEFIKTIAC